MGEKEKDLGVSVDSRSRPGSGTRHRVVVGLRGAAQGPACLCSGSSWGSSLVGVLFRGRPWLLSGAFGGAGGVWIAALRCCGWRPHSALPLLFGRWFDISLSGSSGRLGQLFIGCAHEQVCCRN